jgi:hypothetical protein
LAAGRERSTGDQGIRRAPAWSISAWAAVAIGRTVFVVRLQAAIVDLPDPSKIPALAEPWFLTFEADVEFRVVMSPDDLKRAGLDELGKQWS